MKIKKPLTLLLEKELKDLKLFLKQTKSAERLLRKMKWEEIVEKKATANYDAMKSLENHPYTKNEPLINILKAMWDNAYDEIMTLTPETKNGWSDKRLVKWGDMINLLPEFLPTEEKYKEIFKKTDLSTLNLWDLYEKRNITFGYLGDDGTDEMQQNINTLDFFIKLYTEPENAYLLALLLSKEESSHQQFIEYCTFIYHLTPNFNNVPEIKISIAQYQNLLEHLIKESIESWIDETKTKHFIKLLQEIYVYYN